MLLKKSSVVLVVTYYNDKNELPNHIGHSAEGNTQLLRRGGVTHPRVNALSPLSRARKTLRHSNYSQQGLGIFLEVVKDFQRFPLKDTI